MRYISISRDRWITRISPRLFFAGTIIANVGLTEAQAREKYLDIGVYQTRFTPIKNTLSGLDENDRGPQY
ncbi:MAG TPA: hypothetical protein VIE65_21495 [Methylobacter sp.]